MTQSDLLRQSASTTSASGKAEQIKTPHTPGPWIADDFCMQDGHRVRVGTNDGTPTYYHQSVTICECYAHYIDDEEEEAGNLIDLMQAEFNARFIAAAPETAAERDRLKAVNAELLAALEAVMNLKAEHPLRLDPVEREQMFAVHRRARAAIAKAQS